jgi:hypothetical protein
VDGVALILCVVGRLDVIGVVLVWLSTWLDVTDRIVDAGAGEIAGGIDRTTG